MTYRGRYLFLLLAVLIVVTLTTATSPELQLMPLQSTTFSPLPTPLFPDEGGSDKDIWDKLGSISGAVSAVFEVGAIAVGAIWTYLLFIKKRQKYPRAKIEHYTIDRPVAEGKNLVQVAVTVSNIGDVLLSLVSAQTWIQQVIPLSHDLLSSISKGDDPVKEGETEIEWPLLEDREEKWKRGECQIEPGESEKFRYDFVVSREVQTIRVYSYFKNATQHKHQIGWSLATIYDLEASRQQGENSVGGVPSES